MGSSPLDRDPFKKKLLRTPLLPIPAGKDLQLRVVVKTLLEGLNLVSVRVQWGSPNLHPWLESPSLTVVALSLEGRAAATIGWKQPPDWATTGLTPAQVVHFVLYSAACRLDQVGSSCLRCYPAHLAGARAGEGQIGPEA